MVHNFGTGGNNYVSNRKIENERFFQPVQSYQYTGPTADRIDQEYLTNNDLPKNILYDN